MYIYIVQGWYWGLRNNIKVVDGIRQQQNSKAAGVYICKVLNRKQSVEAR